MPGMKLALILVTVSLFAQQQNVLVVTAGSGDYLLATGGTLAGLIDQGYAVYVLQFANDEKNSIGLSPAETRLRNNEEGEQAARMLGIREVINLNHKSAELSQVSSNEMRNQIMALIRFLKPKKIFHPDPFVHYEQDWDQFWAGRAAEESSYGSSNYFLAEIGRMGFPAYGVPETYYYAVNRPYRPGEGGHNGAKFTSIDITKNFNRKVNAMQALRTANYRFAAHLNLRSKTQIDLTQGKIAELVRAYVEEFSSTIGAKHGFTYGEEFNYHGAGDPIPAHVRERAVPIAR